MVESKKKVEATTGVLIKSSFWYTVSGFLSRAAVFLTTPLFTRLLTQEQYGNFTVFASWQVILLTICGLEVYATINRARFDFTDADEFNGYITTSLFLSTIFTAVVFALYLLFPAIFQKVFLIDHKYMMFMFLYVFTYPAFGMFQAKQRIEYKYKLNAAITFTVVMGSTVLSVALAVFLKEDRLWGRIIGQYGLYIAVGLVFYISFMAKSISIRSRYFKYALRFSIPLVFTYLGSSILLTSDNLVLKHMCSAEQVGYLSITHTCAQIMIILVQLLNNAWSPWFYDKLNSKEYEGIYKTFRVYMLLVIVGTFAVISIAPEIVLILGGKNYLEAIYIIPVNILNGVFSVLSYQFSNLETYCKKPEYSAIITGCVAVINIVLDIAGVWIWGYRAVCYATLLCQILLVVVHYFCTIKMGIEKLLPIRDLCYYIILSIILIPVAFLLYQSNLIRWGAICIIFSALTIILYLKRKDVVATVKKFRI